MLLTLALMVTTVVPPELLAKAAADDARMKAITDTGSFRLQVVVDELDDRGKVTKNTVSTFRISHPDGKAHEEVLSHTEDGRDETESFKKARAEQKKQPDGAAPSPFAAEAQPKYRFKELPPDPKHPTWVRVAVEPAGELSETLMIGEATLEADTAHLVHLSLRPSKLPLFAKSAQIDIDYATPTPTGPVISRMEVRGTGGFAFFIKRIRSVLTFGDFANR